MCACVRVAGSHFPSRSIALKRSLNVLCTLLLLCYKQCNLLFQHHHFNNGIWDNSIIASYHWEEENENGNSIRQLKKQSTTSSEKWNKIWKTNSILIVAISIRNECINAHNLTGKRPSIFICVWSFCAKRMNERTQIQKRFKSQTNWVDPIHKVMNKPLRSFHTKYSTPKVCLKLHIFCIFFWPFLFWLFRNKKKACKTKKLTILRMAFFPLTNLIFDKEKTFFGRRHLCLMTLFCRFFMLNLPHSECVCYFLLKKCFN